MTRSKLIFPTVLAAGAVTLAIGFTNKAAEAQSLRLVANDYGYEVEGAPSAGPVEVELVNEGHELHHAQLIRLDEGKTLADLAQADLEHAPPSWAVMMGGPNAVEPGDSGSAYATLEAGNYAVICIIPSPDGKLHVMKGMASSFEVKPATGRRLREAPQSEVTIRLKDFAFDGPSQLHPGKHAIRVINDGPQNHEVVFVRLNEGKTAEDLFSWFRAGMVDVPPAHFVGGTVGLAPGGANTIVEDLSAGNYLLLCFLPNTAGHGEPHLAQGMILSMAVK